MASRHEALRRTMARHSVRRSLVVAAVIGTILNAINQGSEILRGDWPNLWKLGLTYAVPFLVASYGSYAAFRQAGSGGREKVGAGPREAGELD